HLDIIGLALVAIGVFLAGVDYFHWAGGTVGNGTVKATKFVLGEIGYAFPVGMVAAGGLVLGRELQVLSAVRPVRTGTICLVAALTLALTAGTLDLGPGQVSERAIFHASAMEARGGIIGAVEYWVSSHLFSTVGSHILAVFLLLAGVILLSGAGIASWIRVTGDRVLAGGRGVGVGVGGSRGGIRLSEPDDDDYQDVVRPVTAAGRSSFEIPEPETAELVVRATHVEAPA